MAEGPRDALSQLKSCQLLHTKKYIPSCHLGWIGSRDMPSFYRKLASKNAFFCLISFRHKECINMSWVGLDQLTLIHTGFGWVALVPASGGTVGRVGLGCEVLTHAHL